jgi:hypothetical protein
MQREARVTRRAQITFLGVVIALTSLLAPSSAAAAQGGRSTELVSSQPDGQHVFWGGRAWPEPLVSEDGRHAFFVGGVELHSRQLFEHANGTTTLVSTGPSPGDPNFTMCEAFTWAPCQYGVSSDGSRVYFSTAQPLVGQDTDFCTSLGDPSSGGCGDVYEHSGGSTRLVSIGSTGGNGPFTADLSAVSRDGTRAFFETKESLLPADTDDSNDLYESVGDTVRLFPSAQPAAGDTEEIGIGLDGASANAARIFFSTRQSFSPADDDACQYDGEAVGCVDVYERTEGGRILLVTAGPGGPSDTWFNAASADGSKVFFTTRESLVSDDRDSCPDINGRVEGCGDIYERNLKTGTTMLISTGPDRDIGPGGDTQCCVGFDAASEDGTHVAFTTTEPLLSSDNDTCDNYGVVLGCRDIYERSPQGLELVSTGERGGNGSFNADFGAMSADGKRVSFSTGESLVSVDTDSCDAYYGFPSGCPDVYERAGGTTRLVSTGPAGGNGPVRAEFDGASADGRRIFFHTTESLVPADTDACPYGAIPLGPGCWDVYERFNGTTTLLSTGPSDTGSCHIDWDGHQADCPWFLDASADGKRVFFGTNQPLVPSDTNGPYGYDIYVSKVAPPGCRPNKPGHTPGKCAR